MADFRKDKLEERYRNDILFHNLVSGMQNMIEKNGVTPSEMREALFYAHYRYEMFNPSPMIITKDMEEQIRRVHEFSKREDSNG